MYMMPFPFFGTSKNEDMNFKDWIEALKQYEEWKKANEPKKKDEPKPNYWEKFFDNWAMILFFHSMYIVIGTIIILALTQGHH